MNKRWVKEDGGYTLYFTMKTRFDNAFWVTGMGEVLQIHHMETDHLLNTLKRFVQKPDRTINMIIKDIENNPDLTPFSAWGSDHSTLIKQSIWNVTKMTIDEVIEYAMNSPLGAAMRNELSNRGVDVANYLNIVYGLEGLNHESISPSGQCT